MSESLCALSSDPLGNCPMRRTRVVVADDHPVFLLGVRYALEGFDDIALVAQARQSTELVEALRRAPADVVVTDLSMPGGRYGDGLAMIGYLRRHFPVLKIVVLTMLGNGALIQRLFEVGIEAVVGKCDDLSHVGLAVRHAMGGARYIGPSLRAAMDARAQVLSPREMEVVRLFASGLSVSEIGVRLNRSIKTISSQKGSALRKLGLTRDIELIDYAHVNGLAYSGLAHPAMGHSGISDRSVRGHGAPVR